MSKSYADYRRQAQICREFAGRAVTTQLKEAWHSLARDWLAMIPPEEQAAEDGFAAPANDHGVGQDSQASH